MQAGCTRSKEIGDSLPKMVCKVNAIFINGKGFQTEKCGERGLPQPQQ